MIEPMGVSASLHIEIDGRPARAEALWSTASAYGHFTAMQVRGRRTRGLALHLGRLEAANSELFAAGLDRARVRGAHTTRVGGRRGRIGPRLPLRVRQGA